MAKTSQELTTAQKKAIMDKMAESINKKYNRTVCGRLGNTPDLQEQLKMKFIEMPSPTLNDALGGGIPRKRITILSGAESTGKTGTLLETIAINQKKDPNFTALWLESEDSFDPDFAEMLGVDMDRFQLLLHDKDRGGEACIDDLLGCTETNIFDIVVVNSLKALVPKSELDNSMTKDTMALQARFNAKFMRKLGPIIADSNAAIVLVNHLTTNIGGYGDPLIQSGGKAIRYYATMILDFRRMSIGEGEPIKKDEGMKVNCHVRKNRCIFDRNALVESSFYITYGEGTEQILETLQIAIGKGILQKGGAWIKEDDPQTGEPKVLQDGTVLKWQGKLAFKEFCKTNPAYFEDLKFRCGAGYTSLSEEEIAMIEEEEKEAQTVGSKLEEELDKESKKNKKKKAE